MLKKTITKAKQIYYVDVFNLFKQYQANLEDYKGNVAQNNSAKIYKN